MTKNTNDFFRNKPVFSAGHIPSNCNDLNNMGHTLNGIYLVKDAKTRVNGNVKSDMLNAVFCNFQQPSSTTESSSGNIPLYSIIILY